MRAIVAKGGAIPASWRSVIGVLLLASPAAAGAQSAASGDQLQEVVVTAEKRAATVQETPISITAVTGDQLQREGIADIEHLASQTPGVSMESEGPGRSQFDIRGLSNSGGSSPTVGYYLDDVPVSPPSSQLAAAGKTEIDPDLYDLARVEVLRGPQGTLYGASSMGGTIRLITNDPKLDVIEGSTQLGFSGTEDGGVNYVGNAMLNVPLVDGKLAARLVVTEKYDSGFIDRIVLSDFPLPVGNTRGNVLTAPVAKTYSDVNDDRTQGVRAALVFKPIDNLSIEPSVFVQKLTTGGLSAIDAPPSTMAHYQPADVGEGYVQSFYDYSLRAKYDFGGVAFESITSELHDRSFVNEDDAENLLYGFGPVGNHLTLDNETQEWHKSHQFNEELRLSSTDESPLQWIVGGFYSQFTDSLGFNETSADYASLFGTNDVFTDEEPDHLNQEAVFGEINYQLTPEFKATVGLRYFHYTFSYSQFETGLAAIPGLFSGSSGASGFTPKFTLTYTPLKDLLVYSTASEGFRPGGPNLPIPFNNVINCTDALHAVGLNAEPQTFQPDTVWNYEVGEKARLLDGRVTVNGDLYYIDWSKIQQQVTLNCGYYFTANAGSATSKGGEIEVEAKLLPGLKVQQSLGYTKAELTNLLLPGNSPLGQQLPDVPEWTFATSLEYTIDLADEWTLDALATNRFVGAEFDYSAVPADFTRKPAYDVVDARIGVAKDAWSAYLFVDNLLDRRAILGVNRAETENDPWAARLITNRPRTIGLVAQYSF